MTIRSNEQQEFHKLETRLATLLPEMYQDCYDSIMPVSMVSTSLKYSSDGKVAWDEIWGSFCDLAMAGGPPHKGKLLEPAGRKEIDAEPERYREVVSEICRGITMVTGLFAEPAPSPGWIKMHCTSAAMAGWLARAIVMENVSANFKGLALNLPAGPHYRIEKEVKNVITVVAKTCHYWLEHTSADQHLAIGALFLKMESESPLMQTVLLDYDFQSIKQQMFRNKIAASILESTGLQSSDHQYAVWLGIDCKGIHAAIWMMRILIVSNVFARREETVVFVPVNPISDPDGKTVVRTVVQAHKFAVARKILLQP